MLTKVKDWLKENQEAVSLAGIFMGTAVITYTACRAMAAIVESTANATGEQYEDIEWSQYEPERPDDIVVVANGDVLYDNTHNNDMITNALRLANAVVDGKRDPEWAMPIIKDWLDEVE